MSVDCTCRSEIGDAPCAKHDCDPPDVTEPHVQAWRDFLRTVQVRGPIPIRFRLHRSRDGLWILESKMLVPDRDTAHECQFCGRVYRDAWITFDNALPGPDVDKALIIRQRVLGMFQHEALESIFIGGHRAFDPHEARWYSNLVADWRFNV